MGLTHEHVNGLAQLLQRNVNGSLTSLDLGSIEDRGLHMIGNALLSGSSSSLCALQCDAFNVPLGAASLDLSGKRLGAAAGTLLAGVLKGNTTVTSLK